MATKLLDTTFLVHYWRGEESVAAYLAAHEDATEFVTTTINVKELAVGRELQGTTDHRDLLETFGWVRLVPFDVDHALAAARMEAVLRGDETVDGHEVNALAGDVLIAAVADVLDAPVVTRNTADFERFEGVSVETY